MHFINMHSDIQTPEHIEICDHLYKSLIFIIYFLLFPTGSEAFSIKESLELFPNNEKLYQMCNI